MLCTPSNCHFACITTNKYVVLIGALSNSCSYAAVHAGYEKKVCIAHVVARRWGIIEEYTDLDGVDHPRNMLRLLAPLKALFDRGQMTAHGVLIGKLPHDCGICMFQSLSL